MICDCQATCHPRFREHMAGNENEPNEALLYKVLMVSPKEFWKSPTVIGSVENYT